MRRNSVYNVVFRRKRKNLTNYRKRLKILASKRPRLVVRKSLKSIQASIVDYNKNRDIAKASSHSENLKKFGWNYGTGNIPAAYLTGFLLGKKAREAKIEEAILDIGLQKSVNGSRIYAVLAGAVDAGLKIPHNPDVLPSKERLSGAHISNYAKHLKENDLLAKKQFNSYIKNKIGPEDIEKNFEDVKRNIIKL